MSSKPVFSPRSWHDSVLMGGLLVLVAAGLIGAAAATGWQETLDQIKMLTVPQIGFLLILSLLNYAMRAARWHVFATRLGLTTSFWQNCRHYLGGFAMTVTPGRVGELIRMRWLHRETGWTMERTAPLALVDRAADLAAMGVILGVALALSSGGIAFAIPVAALALGVAALATNPRLLAWGITLMYRVTGLFPRLMVRIRHAARSLKHFMTPGVLAAVGALSLLGWLAEGYAFHLLLMWMGHEMAFWKAVAIFVFATLAGGLTGAPGGVGGAEAAMIALLSLEGVPLEASIPATVIIRLTTLWFAIAIGLLLFPVAERNSLKARHGLED